MIENNLKYFICTQIFRKTFSNRQLSLLHNFDFVLLIEFDVELLNCSQEHHPVLIIKTIRSFSVRHIKRIV